MDCTDSNDCWHRRISMRCVSIRMLSIYLVNYSLLFIVSYCVAECRSDVTAFNNSVASRIRKDPQFNTAQL